MILKAVRELDREYMAAIDTENLKVLYSTYPTAFQIFGGSEVQLLKTKEHLEKLGGCTIKLFDMFNDRLDRYDILHVFYMHPDSLSLCYKAKRAGAKFVLSPIYWRERAKLTHIFGPLALARFYSNMKRYKIPTSRELFPFKDFLEFADIILPNAEMEALLLSRDFRVDRRKFWVVPNGVEERFAWAKPDIFVEKYGVTDFALFVGRIDPRKNVLAVINICKDLNIPLVVVGYPDEIEYFAECQKAAQTSENIRWIGFLPHDSEQLCSAYAAAKVLVLPSNFETPGLTALEAGLAGCNIVITSQGSTKEYFRDYAWYVDPWSIEDLRVKIKDAYEQPKSAKLKRLILENYTWEKVAERTLDAYRSILNTAPKKHY